MDHLLFQAFKIILSALLKKHETIVDNPPVQVYTNKIKNRVVFRIKTDYKLELLSRETTKLLGRTKKDVDQDKDGDDVPNLESAGVVLVHCNLVNSNYQQASKVLLDPRPQLEGSYKIGFACWSFRLSFHPSFCLSVSFLVIGSLVFSEI